MSVKINFRESTYCRLPDDGLVKPKHVGAFILIFNVNFNILKQFKCTLVRQIKDLIILRVYKFGSSYIHVNVVKMKSGRRFSGKLPLFVDS